MDWLHHWKIGGTMSNIGMQEYLQFKLSQNKGKVAETFEDIEDGAVISSSYTSKYKTEIVFIDLKQNLLIFCYYIGNIMDSLQKCVDITDDIKPHIVRWYNEYNSREIQCH